MSLCEDVMVTEPTSAAHNSATTSRCESTSDCDLAEGSSPQANSSQYGQTWIIGWKTYMSEDAALDILKSAVGQFRSQVAEWRMFPKSARGQRPSDFSVIECIVFADHLAESEKPLGSHSHVIGHAARPKLGESTKPVLNKDMSAGERRLPCNAESQKATLAYLCKQHSVQSVQRQLRYMHLGVVGTHRREGSHDVLEHVRHSRGRRSIKSFPQSNAQIDSELDLASSSGRQSAMGCNTSSATFSQRRQRYRTLASTGAAVRVGLRPPQESGETLGSTGDLPDVLGAPPVWLAGNSGRGARVAILDSGLDCCGSRATDRAGAPARNARECRRSGRIGNVAECTDWTTDSGGGDAHGHGTFVAGVVGSNVLGCRGVAPEASLYIGKVFSSEGGSYTGWFLEALDWALSRKVHIVNLSIGGPDSSDALFSAKIEQLTAAGVLVVSGVGNSGPGWGTHMSPADLPSVLGVGALSADGDVARYSSRGMTLSELHVGGHGRPKPDLLAFGSGVAGLRVNGGCTVLSGTSVASPVAAAAAAMLVGATLARAEELEANGRPDAAAAVLRMINAASLKAQLMEGARLLRHRSGFEQGAGALQLRRSLAIAAAADAPGVVIFPPMLQLHDCAEPEMRHGLGQNKIEDLDHAHRPHIRRKHTSNASQVPSSYLWPLCSQPLFHGRMPMLINLTVLNGKSARASVSAFFNDTATTETDTAMIRVFGESAPRLWPFGGGMGIAISATERAAPVARASAARTVARGKIVFKLTHMPGPSPLPRLEAADGVFKIAHNTAAGADHGGAVTRVEVPASFSIVPPPPRRRRLLWDQRRSLRYPPVYAPRDTLPNADSNDADEVLDWAGDHVHSNFRHAYAALLGAGYFIDVLSCSWLTVDASAYAALLIVDPERDFAPDEISKLFDDVVIRGMSVVVMAEWYNVRVSRKLAFYDENSGAWLTLPTGGANVPAINSALAPFGVGFADAALSGELPIGEHRVPVQSATAIDTFPEGGYLLRAPVLTNDAAQMTSILKLLHARRYNVPLLGLLQLSRSPKDVHSSTLPIGGGAGRLVVFADSFFADSHAAPTTMRKDQSVTFSQDVSREQQSPSHLWLLVEMVEFAASGKRDLSIFHNATLTTSPLQPSRSALAADVSEFLEPHAHSICLLHSLGLPATPPAPFSRPAMVPTLLGEQTQSLWTPRLALVFLTCISIASCLALSLFKLDLGNLRRRAVLHRWLLRLIRLHAAVTARKQPAKERPLRDWPGAECTRGEDVESGLHVREAGSRHTRQLCAAFLLALLRAFKALPRVLKELRRRRASKWTYYGGTPISLKAV